MRNYKIIPVTIISANKILMFINVNFLWMTVNKRNNLILQIIKLVKFPQINTPSSNR